jgi:hypothetical protein
MYDVFNIIFFGNFRQFLAKIYSIRLIRGPTYTRVYMVHLIHTSNHQEECEEMAQDVKTVKNFNTLDFGDAVLAISQKCDE